jgi:outer membrane protein TolC
VQKLRLSRSTKLRDWSANRAKTGLADRADLLQSEAAVKVSQLELQAAFDDEKVAARNLNRMRGVDTTVVAENLPPVDEFLIANTRLPKYSQTREDVLAAKEVERVAKAGATLSAEKLTPNLELFGSYALNGRDEERAEAEDEAFEGERTTRLIGVRFSAALGVGQVHRTKAAYLRERNAAEFSAKQKQFDADRDWQDLKLRFDEAKTRYQLARAIEKAQGEKVDHERIRYNRGRSTTAQVLMFEQDFSLSQLNRIKVQGEVLAVATQLKAFASGN